MSEENKTMTPEQEKLIREALVKSIFEPYQKLVEIFRKLPVPSYLPGMQKAALDLDTAMLWIKELLLTAPLNFAKVEKEEEKPSEENDAA